MSNKPESLGSILITGCLPWIIAGFILSIIGLFFDLDDLPLWIFGIILFLSFYMIIKAKNKLTQNKEVQRSNQLQIKQSYRDLPKTNLNPIVPQNSKSTLNSNVNQRNVLRRPGSNYFTPDQVKPKESIDSPKIKLPVEMDWGDKNNKKSQYLENLCVDEIQNLQKNETIYTTVQHEIITAPEFLQRTRPNMSERYKSDWASFRESLRFYQITYLYHFTDECNVDSIRYCKGLYSWQYCQDNEIQIKQLGGNNVSRMLENRKCLEDYIHLSFNSAQPMLFVAKSEGRIITPVILKIDPSVIYWEDTLFSDKNATDGGAIIGGTYEDFCQINLKVATSSRWTGLEEKKLFQAEVLVKTHIPLQYIQFPKDI